ncbi:hypothetical protein [Robertmurraya massiliosenegalensis]|uniref:hypothetical protein n=1 Tax=Robertmurraya massiliosenegalensis TaxID=1287657 RepID=UPI00036D54C0|nr:hypothetical protein [Robertmurraya massiliosenegalensis]
MKWSYLLTTTAFVGFFSLGVMVTPNGMSSATVKQQDASKGLSVIQTVDEQESNQEGETEWICPVTGESNGMRTGMGMTGGMMTSMSELLSDGLGMTIEEFQTARMEGKSVAEMVEEKGIKFEDLVKAVIEERKSELAQQVNDGVLTQDQMENRLRNMETMMNRAFEQDGTGHMRGSKMGMKQGSRWSNDAKPQQTQIGTGTQF